MIHALLLVFMHVMNGKSYPCFFLIHPIDRSQGCIHVKSLVFYLHSTTKCIILVYMMFTMCLLSYLNKIGHVYMLNKSFFICFSLVTWSSKSKQTSHGKNDWLPFCIGGENLWWSSWRMFFVWLWLLWSH